MNKKLEWVILVTEKFAESRTFYKDILGLEILREFSKEEFVQFRMDNCYLVIYGKKEIEKLIGKGYIRQASSAIYSFGEVKDVDEIYDSLVKKGVKFIKKPTTQSWGQRTAYFLDSDGHIWEIQKWVK